MRLEDTVHQRRSLRVASDPTDVSHAREFILGVNVKDIFDSQGSSEKVPSSSMDNTLRLSGGSGGLR